MADPFERYECPVDDCRWTLDVFGMELTGALLPGLTIGEAIASTVHEIGMQRAQLVEGGLREHLESHAAEDYLRTIQRLKWDLEEARHG